jgi:hypothetical protein
MALVTQATAAMTRKQFWTLIASSSTTVVLWLVGQLSEIVVTTEITGTLVVMAGAIAGYAVKDKKPNGPA